jgi:hypothetical protein
MRAPPCARLSSYGHPDNASMLPGDGQHYLVTGAPLQCLTTQLGAEYVKFGAQETLKITAFAREQPAAIIFSAAMRTAPQ